MCIFSTKILGKHNTTMHQTRNMNKKSMRMSMYTTNLDRSEAAVEKVLQDNTQFLESVRGVLFLASTLQISLFCLAIT